MTKNETARILIDAIEACDYTAESYSGRGMYGDQCVSVTGSPGMLLAIGAELAAAGADLYAFTRGMREDSMGREAVYYWPSFPWPTDDEAEETVRP